MKTTLTTFTSTFAFAFCGLLSIPNILAQEDKEAAEKPAEISETPDQAAAKPTQAELEAEFVKTLTKATMNGRWCIIRDGELTPEKEEQYVIESVAKLEGNSWVVNARIKYNDVDFVAPIPVKVEWAGDTPVIIVDDLQVPGGNSYSARVLVYDDTYAGTWSGKDVKGLLNGWISQDQAEKE